MPLIVKGVLHSRTGAVAILLTKVEHSGAGGKPGTEAALSTRRSSFVVMTERVSGLGQRSQSPVFASLAPRAGGGDFVDQVEHFGARFGADGEAVDAVEREGELEGLVDFVAAWDSL